MSEPVMQTLKKRAKLLIDQERLHISKRGQAYFVGFALNLIILYHLLDYFRTWWPAYLSNHEPVDIQFYLTLSITYLTIIINILAYAVIDHFDLAPNNKIVKKGGIWQTDPAKWQQLKKKSIMLTIINGFVLNTIFNFLDRGRSKLSFDPEIPSMFVVIIQFMFCLMVQAFFFYIFHRVGHEYLYQFHKVHHEFNVTTPLAAAHFHPIDYIIGVILPFAIGPKILGGRMHYLTYLIWLVWRSTQGFQGHSNYDFKWSPLRCIPFASSSSYHSFHHTDNVGNFGSTQRIEDTITATNAAYYRKVQ